MGSYCVNEVNGILRTSFYIFKEVRYILDVNFKRVVYLALVPSVFSYYGLCVQGAAFNNIILSNLNVTINDVIKYLLNLPMQTNTILIVDKCNVNNFEIIF